MKKEKNEGVKVKLSNVILTFPNLATSQYYDNEKDIYIKLSNDTEEEKSKYPSTEYGGQLIIEKGSKNHKLIKSAVDSIWKQRNLEKQNRAIYPLKDGDEKADFLEKEEKNGEQYKGMILFKAHTKFKPKKIFTKVKGKLWNGSIPSDDDAINGFFINVIVEAKYYKKGSNIGVTIYLNGIQLLEQNPDFDFSNDCESEFDFEESEPEISNDNNEGFEFNDNTKKIDDNDDDDLPFK